MSLSSRKVPYTHKVPAVDIKDDPAFEEEINGILRTIGTHANPLPDRIAAVTEFLYKARDFRLNSIAEPLWRAVQDMVALSADALEAALKVMQAIILQTAACEAEIALEREFFDLLRHMEYTERRRALMPLSTLCVLSRRGKLGASIAKDMIGMLLAMGRLHEAVEHRHVIFDLISHYLTSSPMSIPPSDLRAITQMIALHVKQTVNVSVPSRTSKTYYFGVKSGLLLLDKMVAQNVVQCPHLLDIVTILCLTVRMHVAVGGDSGSILVPEAESPEKAAPSVEATIDSPTLAAIPAYSGSSSAEQGPVDPEHLSAAVRAAAVAALGTAALVSAERPPAAGPARLVASAGDAPELEQGYASLHSADSTPTNSPRGDGSAARRRASDSLRRMVAAGEGGLLEGVDGGATVGDAPGSLPLRSMDDLTAVASGASSLGRSVSSAAVAAVSPAEVGPPRPLMRPSASAACLHAAPSSGPSTPTGQEVVALPADQMAVPRFPGWQLVSAPSPREGAAAAAGAAAGSAAQKSSSAPAPRLSISYSSSSASKEKVMLTNQSRAVLTNLLNSDLRPSVVYVLCALLIQGTADSPQLETCETDTQKTQEWEEGMARARLGSGEDARTTNYERDVEVMEHVLSMHAQHVQNLQFYLNSPQQTQFTPVHLMKIQGAIFLLANACWGKERLPDMGGYFPVAVSALMHSLAVCDPGVTYEVLLTSKKLIKTFNSRLHLEWDGLLQILRVAYVQYRHFSIHFHIPNKQRKEAIEGVKQQVREIAELVYGYYVAGQFLGDEDDADATFDTLKSLLSPKVLGDLLCKRFERIHPADSGWLDQLAGLMQRYFAGYGNRSDKVQAVRKASLQLLYNLLVNRFPYFASEILDAGLLPFLRTMYQEPDMPTVEWTCCILLTAAAQLYLSPEMFQRVIENLHAVILIPKLGETTYRSLVGQLIKLFQGCLLNYPAQPAIVVFRELIQLTGHQSQNARLAVYTALSQLQADADYHIVFGTVLSPYVRACQCAERELERDAPEGPATEGSPARLEEHCPLKLEVGAVEDEEAPPHRPTPDRDPRVCSLPVAELVEKLLSRLETEDDPLLFRTILAILLHYLSSHYLLAAVPISVLCLGLHHAMGSREDFFFLLQSPCQAEGLEPLRPHLGEFYKMPGLQLLMFLLRQLIGYRQEMTEQDIAAIMSMLKRLLTLCAAGSFQDSLETAISFFDLMSLAQLEFRYHLGPQDIMDFVMAPHGLDAFTRLEERGQVSLLETLWLMVHYSPYLADGVEEDPTLQAMARWTESNPRWRVVEKVINYVLPLADPSKHSFRVVHLALHVLSTWFTKYPHQSRAALLNDTIATALLPSAAPSAAANCLQGIHVPYPMFYPNRPPQDPLPPAAPTAAPRKDQASLFTKFWSSGAEKTAPEAKVVAASAPAAPPAAPEKPPFKQEASTSRGEESEDEWGPNGGSSAVASVRGLDAEGSSGSDHDLEDDGDYSTEGEDHELLRGPSFSALLGREPVLPFALPRHPGAAALARRPPAGVAEQEGPLMAARGLVSASLDFMLRWANLSCDPYPTMPAAIRHNFQHTWSRFWGLGSSILTLTVAPQSMEALLTYRMITGTVVWTMCLLNRSMLTGPWMPSYAPQSTVVRHELRDSDFDGKPPGLLLPLAEGSGGRAEDGLGVPRAAGSRRGSMASLEGPEPPEAPPEFYFSSMAWTEPRPEEEQPPVSSDGPPPGPGGSHPVDDAPAAPRAPSVLGTAPAGTPEAGPPEEADAAAPPRVVDPVGPVAAAAVSPLLIASPAKTVPAPVPLPGSSPRAAAPGSDPSPGPSPEPAAHAAARLARPRPRSDSSLAAAAASPADALALARLVGSAPGPRPPRVSDASASPAPPPLPPSPAPAAVPDDAAGEDVAPTASGLVPVAASAPTAHGEVEPKPVVPPVPSAPSVGLQSANGGAAHPSPTALGPSIHPDFLMQFLSNLPSLGADRLEALTPIPLDSGSKQFLTSLQLLDTTPCTEASKVGVLYASGSPSCVTDILLNNDCSARFWAFVKGLGTFRELVNVEAPPGCRLGWWPHPPAWSSMDRGRFKTDGEYSLDHVWVTQSLLFHVCPLMPSDPTNSGNNKRRHVGNDAVNIVYADMSYRRGWDEELFYTGQVNQVFLFIQALATGYNHVSVHVAKDSAGLQFGPLRPGADQPTAPWGRQLVSDLNLPDVVRQLCLHAHVACLDGRVKKGYNVSNWGARFDSIRNITKRYAQGPPLAPAAPRERKAA